MANITYNYSLDDVVLIIGGFPITEYGEGEGVKIEFDEDDFNVSQGSHGSVTRAKNHNNVAEMTVRLEQGSPVNAFLSGLNATDRLTRQGSFPVLLKDLLGFTLVSAAQCWINKPGPISLGNEAEPIEWTIKLTAFLNYTVGGNTPA